MYSPKIREELIPKIYQAAKRAGVHMTTWVNEVLEHALAAESEVEAEPKTKRRKKKDDVAAI